MKIIELKDNIYRLECNDREFFASRMQRGFMLLLVVSHTDGTPADAKTRAEAESAIEAWAASQAHDSLCPAMFAAAQKVFGRR